MHRLDAKFSLGHNWLFILWIIIKFLKSMKLLFVDKKNYVNFLLTLIHDLDFNNVNLFKTNYVMLVPLRGATLPNRVNVNFLY